MIPSRLFAGLGLLVLVTWLSCNGAQSEPELTLALSSTTINGNGQKTTVRATATNEEGNAGTGTVTFEAAVGDISEPQAALDPETGRASVEFTCLRAQDPACTGDLKITATWISAQGNKATATKTLKVSQEPFDAGSDGGSMPVPMPDAGSDGGVDAGMTSWSDAGLSLSLSRGAIFIGAQDAVTLTAQLTGVSAVEGQELKLTTTTGLLRTAADAGASPALTMNTDANGTVSAQLIDAVNQSAQTATVTVTHMLSGKSVSGNVEMLKLRQVSFVDTRCGTTTPTNCTLMGIKGSGYQEVAQVLFRVTDDLGRPAVGATVSFSLHPPPSGVTLEKLSEVTNAMGEVTASVQSGSALNVFAVQATVVPGKVEGVSNTLAIRGAKPSNKQFALFCTSVNIPAYKAANPPAQLNMSCTVRVVDRHNNPVGTGLAVRLLTEAGSVGNDVVTKPFMNYNADEGTGVFNFGTVGGSFPPKNTTPFTANAAQFPFPRADEPSRNDGALTRNPRDGLITVLAYVVGEEHFDDNNGNGVYDLGEPFVDQGEPFVDWNDNNICDNGEEATVVQQDPSNGVWDPPNGVYDAVKLIWTETKILATNSAEPSIGTLEGLSPGTCPSGVPKGGLADFDAYLPDLNLNRVFSGGALSIRRVGNRGTTSWVTGTGLLDGYGFGYTRVLVDATDQTKECTPTTTRCVWQSAFGNWGRGWVGVLRVSGVAASDITACENEAALQASVSVLSTDVVTLPISLGVQ